MLLVAVAIPWVGDLLQGPVKRAAAVARARGQPVVQWYLHNPSVAVYRGEVALRTDPAPGELALVRRDRLPAGVPVEVVYEEGGYLLVERRAADGAR